MKPYSEPLVLLARVGKRFRVGVLISSLAFLVSPFASAQQIPVAPAEQPAGATAQQTEAKVASARTDDTREQTSASVSSALGRPAIPGDASSTASVQAPSEGSPEAAAKDAAQNPVAHVISVPFQNNTFFNVGAYRRAENGLIIEPVIPIRLSNNWILITRTITPLIYVPRVSPGEGENFGLGNLNPQFYLSPAHPGKIIWGVGPQLWLPTATNKTLGVNKWGGGPAAVVLTKQGHWLFGALIGNVWTGGAGQQGHESTTDPTVFHSINQMTLNPFVFYNMKRGWYLMSSPIMTSDWAAKAGQHWTVPVGGGFGRVFRMGGQLLNARAQFWSDVKSPTGYQSWTMQTQIQLLFPRK
jgi:hypothetical protein